jgi:spore coat protein U-like protein
MKLIDMVLPVICLIFIAVDGYAFNCSVTSTAVNFGSYNVFSSSPLDSTGTITITCNNPEKKPMPVTIAISSGGSGSFNPRQMRLAGGSDRMNYYLFSDPSKTVIWGDGTGGSSSITSTIDRNPNLTATIYGRVPAKQDLRAGTYSDTLVVTVTW